MNDDWAMTDCDLCGDYRKCYLQEDDRTYICNGEDCVALHYYDKHDANYTPLSFED